MGTLFHRAPPRIKWKHCLYRCTALSFISLALFNRVELIIMATPRQSIIATPGSGPVPPTRPVDLVAPQQAPATPTSPGAILALIGAGVLLPFLLAYGLVATDEAQVIAVLMGVIFILVIMAKPFWGLMVFIGLLYTRPEESVRSLAGMHMTLLVSIVTAAAALFQLALSRGQIVRAQYAIMAVGFYVCCIFTSVVGGTMGGAILDVGRLVIIVFLVLNLIRTPKQYSNVVTAIIIFISYLAAYSILLYLSGQTLLDRGAGGIVRSKGTGIFSDPNDLASSFAACIAFVLVRISEVKRWQKGFYFVPLGILFWAFMLTNSRGGLQALFVVIAGFFIIPSRYKVIGMTMTALLIIGVVVAAPGRMTSLDSKDTSANNRFLYWDNGIRMMTSNPLTGVGYFRFKENNDRYTAHNSFVLCFGENGLPAYFFWMGCLYYAFRRRPSKVQGEMSKAMGNRFQAWKWQSKRAKKEVEEIKKANEVALQEEAREAVAAYDDPELAKKHLFGAKLALAGYMVASFWLSHTYSPVLFILMSMPVAQQIAARGKNYPYLETSQEKWKDYGRIVGLCLASIVFIFLVEIRMK